MSRRVNPRRFCKSQKDQIEDLENDDKACACTNRNDINETSLECNLPAIFSYASESYMPRFCGCLQSGFRVGLDLHAHGTQAISSDKFDEM